MRYLIILLCLTLAQACSNRQVYDAIQNRQKVLCQEVPRSEYQKCMEEADASYDTYKKERDKVEETQ
jgi:hypothetical protein